MPKENKVASYTTWYSISITYDQECAGFTYRSKKTQKLGPKIYVFFLKGGAYAPYASCMSIPLRHILYISQDTFRWRYPISAKDASISRRVISPPSALKELLQLRLRTTARSWPLSVTIDTFTLSIYPTQHNM